MWFTFVDDIVKTAHKYPHLPFDLLPPLADTDRSAYLKAKGFPVLDPMQRLKASKPRRQLFWGLMEYFRECCQL